MPFDPALLTEEERAGLDPEEYAEYAAWLIRVAGGDEPYILPDDRVPFALADGVGQ